MIPETGEYSFVGRLSTIDKSTASVQISCMTMEEKDLNSSPGYIEYLEHGTEITFEAKSDGIQLNEPPQQFLIKVSSLLGSPRYYVARASGADIIKQRQLLSKGEVLHLKYGVIYTENPNHLKK